MRKRKRKQSAESAASAFVGGIVTNEITILGGSRSAEAEVAQRSTSSASRVRRNRENARCNTIPDGEEPCGIVDCRDPGGDFLTILHGLPYFRFGVKG